jgi:hypothetical protein
MPIPPTKTAAEFIAAHMKCQREAVASAPAGKLISNWAPGFDDKSYSTIRRDGSMITEQAITCLACGVKWHETRTEPAGVKDHDNGDIG